MFFIVVIHTLSHGGILDAAEPLSPNYIFAYGLNLITYCAVNCYAIISGYVGCNKNFKLSRIINLWSLVVFWSIALMLFTFALRPELFSYSEILSAVMPTLKNRYWYFTAYVALFFFMPILNKILHTLTKKQLQKLIVVMGILFTVCQIIALGNDVFMLKNGYSFIWLAALYILGGYIKLYPPKRLQKNFVYLLCFFGCALLNLVLRIAIEIVTTRFLGYVSHERMFMVYTSPVVVAQAIFLFEYFRGMNFLNKPKVSKVIGFLAPLTFGVYIIHKNRIFVTAFLEKSIVSYVNYSPAIMVMLIIATAVGVYIACSALEYLRVLLFKLLRIGKLTDSLGNWVTIRFDSLFKTKTKKS